MPKAKPTLPPPAELERICKGIATLDAIASEDWEDRYYSFDRAWDAKAKRRMASMRNGSGDDWFIVFAPGGAFVKALWHEYPDEDVAAIYAGLPAKLAPLRTEAAFSMNAVTFGGFHDGRAWTLRGNAKPMADELAILGGDPAAYRAYASEYFEHKLPAAAIARVLAGDKLDDKLVTKLGGTRTLDELADDLAGIGY